MTDFIVPVEPSDSAHGETSDQHSSRHVSCDSCDFLSRNDDGPSALHVRSRLACGRMQSGEECQADMASPGTQQSQSHSSFSSSSANDLVTQLHVRLAPLSDFLTEHLAVLRTWLSCASYGQLVVVLCQYIAEVNYIDILNQIISTGHCDILSLDLHP